MNELIKVTYDNDRPVVSARELHDFLEVKTAYKDWFPRMCEYGFTEGQDFNPLKNEQVQIEGGRTVTRHILDAALTIDMAKEICMIQRSEKGKQARQYFIQLEKDWNSPEKVMARALDIAHRELNTLKAANVELLAENERQQQIIADFEPMKQYVDTILQSKDAVTTTQIAADYGMSAKELNRILYQEGVQHKVNGQWILYKKHMGKGLTVSRTIHFYHHDGSPDTKMNTCWTQKGRMMIHNILTKRGIVALMDREEA